MNEWWKRLFDLVASAAGLLVLSPVLLLVSLLVKCAGGGPVLFSQERVGLGGRPFLMRKFRTMTVVAGAEKGSFDAGNARRVTPLGRVLRKTKLDEFPQLWNVLTGEMSLVGPRPEVRQWVAAYPERWAVVHTVRPGVTDPASIAFRHEEELLSASPDPERAYREVILPQKLALYEEYVRTRSFWGDIRIIFRTLGAVARLTAGQ